uniref:Protein kinase domain-containing protein n=1 Tax=Cucumis sativus TaxID=3659 RepID=A0A0A0KAE5_CUCSA
MIRQITDWKKNPELQFFDFETIVSATNNFGDECKLGKGGFGPVYKGVMTDGQEVAIKRLSKNSGQGLCLDLFDYQLFSTMYPFIAWELWVNGRGEELIDSGFNDYAQLPSPKQPAFFVAQNPNSSEPEIEDVNNELIRPVGPTLDIYSTNAMTVSVMVAR